MRKIYLIGYSSQSIDNKEKFSKLLEIEELKNLGKLYIGDSSSDIEVSNYITNKSILKIDSRLGDRNLKDSTFPSTRDDILSNGDTLANMENELTEFINAAVNSEINTVGVVVNNIMVLSFLQSMFEFESDGLNYNVTFLNKELLNGSIPNPIIYELVYTDEGQFEDINRITL